MRPLAALALLLLAAPAFAQKTEVALLAGGTTSGDISKKAVGIQELAVEGNFTWGAEAAHFLTDHLGFGASWSEQRSGLAVGTQAGTAELFDMRLGVLQGMGLWQFGPAGGRLRPFLLAGLGATFLSAPDLQGETRFSWSLGGGLKWFPSHRVGTRIQGRYAPTVLGDSSSGVCDPFGFCQGMLHQFELTGGLVLRF